MRWTSNWELLVWRILDLLSLDELMLEEIFINVNFQFQSSEPTSERVYQYCDQFRLADVVVQLRALRSKGLVSTRSSDYPPEIEDSGLWFFLTDAGHEVWSRDVRRKPSRSLYEVHSSGILSTTDARPINEEGSDSGTRPLDCTAPTVGSR